MKILAIDSSSIVASVALWDEDKIIGEFSLECGFTHSLTLMPLIETLFKLTKISLEAIDLISITEGPGSFTGLRIGAATAKGLALSKNIPIMNINTIEALAYNISFTDGIICPIMDAKREEVYTGLYRYDNRILVNVLEPQPLAVETLIEQVNNLNQKIIFLGDGVSTYRSLIIEKCPMAEFAGVNQLTQRASSIIACTLANSEIRKPIDADTFTPIYLRKSQAERERLDK